MSVVVIGGGVNERVAAHLLARAGRQVVLLDDGAKPDTRGWVSPVIEKALSISVSTDRPDPLTIDAIRRLSPRDAERWPEFCERMARLARFLERLYLSPPADPTSFSVAFGVRRLGRQAMEDLMRIVPMPLAELLDDWFESDALKALLAAGPLRHALQGPRSGGTAFCLLHDHVGAPPGAFQPPSSNLHAVLAALPGVQTRQAKVVSIGTGQVTLDGGESIAADTIVSGLHPKRTLLELADPGWLDPELARAVGHIRSRRFAVPREARSLDELERAYDDAKHRRAAVTEGEAELTLDQVLWMRPLPELARYRTPIEGLWLCGESMHPGPGIAGAAGYHCAREILK